MAETPRRGDVPGIQIHLRRGFGESRSTLWSWLTEADRLRSWLADRAEVDLGEAGGFRLESLREDAGPVVETAKTLALEPESRWELEFRRDDPLWEGTTLLEWGLHDARDGCELEVFQEGFQRLALSSCLTIWEDYRRRWRACLDRLDLRLRGG
ncbi:MAG: SRPBCC domain-containing protein [Thermoanaerobaculia bacterium]|nr:SRPBCC domain-containing protein [Thermoanaerobaculia bacterium]